MKQTQPFAKKPSLVRTCAPVYADAVTMDGSEIPVVLPEGTVLRVKDDDGEGTLTVLPEKGIPVPDFPAYLIEEGGGLRHFLVSGGSGVRETDGADGVSAEAGAKTPVESFFGSDKKYSGDEAIDTVIAFLQTNDLSKCIVRDDDKNQFVDLGSADMWPDSGDTGWMMRLNSRIPLSTAFSVALKTIKGNKHLAVVLHRNFI